jgi:hypothetical protein
VKPTDIVALADKLAASGRLLPASTPPPVADGSTRVHQGLVVNLVKAMEQSARAESVDIYADTLVVPEGARVQVGGTPLRLSVIARRIVVESGAARILLDHNGDNPLGALRILAGGIDGDFGVVSVRGRERPAYDLAKLNEDRQRPHYTVFSWRDGVPAISRSEVPPGLLELGRPLYQTLATSFDLCAGALGDHPSRERLDLAQAMLSWIAGFAGLHADLASVARIAEAVRAILPVANGPAYIHPIPPRSAASYKQLAYSRKELAKTVELDMKFLDLTGTISEIAARFASANIERDRVEAKLIEDQLRELASRRQTLAAAMDRVARDIKDKKFEADLQSIHVELALKIYMINTTVKAAFEIVGALISLAGSIGSIAMGVPPLPGGGSHGDIKGVTGLIDAIKDSKSTTVWLPNWANHLFTILNLFALPVTFMWENGADHADSIKTLIAASGAIRTAANSILTAAASPKAAGEMTELVGQAIRAIATKPHPIEAKAAWDAIEIDVVNGLHKLIDDQELSDDVHAEATTYKTMMQKVCIQGRVLSEYQAAADAVDRETGTLILQRCAQIQKEAALQKLRTELTDRKVLTETIRNEVLLRQQAAARAFFEASYGFQRAIFYETYTRTTLANPEVLPEASLMEARYADMVTDFENAGQLIARKRVDFNHRIRIDAPDLMARLKNGSLTMTIDLSHPMLAKLSRVRLKSVQAWLESTPALTERVELKLYNGESSQDREDIDKNIQFFGSVQLFPFEYRGDVVELSRELTEVQLPPFSNWTIAVSQPDPAPTVGALLLRFTGQAFQ